MIVFLLPVPSIICVEGVPCPRSPRRREGRCVVLARACCHLFPISSPPYLCSTLLSILGFFAPGLPAGSEVYVRLPSTSHPIHPVNIDFYVNIRSYVVILGVTPFRTGSIQNIFLAALRCRVPARDEFPP